MGASDSMETRAGDWKMRPSRFGKVAILAILATVAAACGAAQPSSPSSADSVAAAPKVQDCTIISLSVPTKYVCNGKVYTSNELRQLRQAQQSGGASSTGK